MPEATAVKSNPIKSEQPGVASTETWVKYNDQGQIDFQKSVKNKLAEAGIKHDPVPAGDKELPVHVPTSGETVDIHGSNPVALPDTFKPGGLDNIRHIFDFTGDGAPPRVGKAEDIKAAIDKRTGEVMKARNNPRSGSVNIFEAAKNWFYDENNEANTGSNVIQAANRFTNQTGDKKAA